MSKSRIFLICAVAALLFVVMSATGADKKLTDLTALLQADWATNDVIAIVDVGANATKKTTIADFDERYFNESGILTAAQGGTGMAAPAAGNLIYSNGSAWTTVGSACSNAQVLSSNGSGVWACTTPAVGSVTSVSLAAPSIFSVTGSPVTSNGTLTLGYSGTALPVANGGTGLTSGTSGGVLAYTSSGVLASSGELISNQIMVGRGAGFTPTTLAAGSQYEVLRMGASSPAYGALALNQSAAVTGTLPVTNGGTGAATLTANNVLLGNGTSAVTFVAPGTTGNVLKSDGSTWTSGTVTGGSGGGILALVLWWTGSQTITHDADTKLSYSGVTLTEENTTYMTYDSSTDQFTGAEGYFQVTVRAQLERNNNANTMRQFILKIYKNGSLDRRCGYIPGIAGDNVNSGGDGSHIPEVECTFLFYSDGNDYFEVNIYQADGGGASHALLKADVEVIYFANP